MWWWLQGKKPDNAVEETLNGGVPWERSILDVPVASVVLPDDQHRCHPHPQHNRGDQHHPQHDQDDQMHDACQRRKCPPQARFQPGQALGRPGKIIMMIVKQDF